MATLNIFSAGAAQAVVTQIAEKIQRESGTLIDAAYGAVGAMKARIVAGEPADVILVNLRQANAAPVHDLDSALVLCCHAGNVDTVIVAGKLLMHHKRVLVLDEEALLRECEQAVIGLRRRAGLS